VAGLSYGRRMGSDMAFLSFDEGSKRQVAVAIKKINKLDKVRTDC